MNKNNYNTILVGDMNIANDSEWNEWNLEKEGYFDVWTALKPN